MPKKIFAQKWLIALLLGIFISLIFDDLLLQLLSLVVVLILDQGIKPESH